MQIYHLKDFRSGPPYLSLRRQTWERDTRSNAHRHDCVEVVFILSGSGVNFVNRMTFPIIAGDLYVINRGAVHSFYSGSGLKFYNLMFDFRLFSRGEQKLFRSEPGFSELFAPSPDQLPNKLPMTPDEAEKLRWFFDQLYRECRSDRPDAVLNSRAYLTLLLNLLCRIAAAPDRPLQHATANTRVDALSRIIAFLNEHYLEPLDFDELARTAELSPSYIGEFFRVRTGISPVHYVISLRIERARRLLLEMPELTVTEIARRCGFRDSSYFARMFRQTTGQTPRTCRAIGKPDEIQERNP